MLRSFVYFTIESFGFQAWVRVLRTHSLSNADADNQSAINRQWLTLGLFPELRSSVLGRNWIPTLLASANRTYVTIPRLNRMEKLHNRIRMSDVIRQRYRYMVNGQSWEAEQESFDISNGHLYITVNTAVKLINAAIARRRIIASTPIFVPKAHSPGNPTATLTWQWWFNVSTGTCCALPAHTKFT